MGGGQLHAERGRVGEGGNPYSWGGYQPLGRGGGRKRGDVGEGGEGEQDPPDTILQVGSLPEGREGQWVAAEGMKRGGEEVNVLQVSR